MPFAPLHFLRWTRGSTLVGESDAIPPDALRLAQNVRLDRMLGALAGRPGWSRSTLSAFPGPVTFLTKLFGRTVTYAYAQVADVVYRLAGNWNTPLSHMTLGTGTVSTAAQPDGQGNIWRYFASATAFYKDSGGETRLVGLPAATAPPLGVSLGADLSVSIDTMDVAGTWTGDSLGSGPVAAGSVHVEGVTSTAFAISASQFGSIAKMITINLDTIPGGDATVKDDDYIAFWIRLDNPANVSYIQIDFDIDAATTGLADAFQRQAYTVQLPSLTRLSQGSNQWNKIQVRKSEFARIGTEATRSWATVQAVRIGVRTLSTGAVAVWVDDLRLRGGFGLEGSYLYTICYGNSSTFGRGNPPTDAQGVIQFTTPITVDRQRIQIDTTNVRTGGVNFPTDPQVDVIKLWRQGGIFSTPVLVGTFPVTQATPYVDTQSDAYLLLVDTFLETDNDLPPSGTTRFLFGPDGAGHLFLLVDGVFLYISKPYETRENRADNWPRLGYAIIGDGSVKAVAGASTGTVVKVWTQALTYNVVGVGAETYLPVPQDGSRGAVGPRAVCAGEGVFFFVSQDGIWEDANGQQTKLTRAIDPFFEGRTVDGQPGWDINEAQMAQTQLAFLHEPTGGTLVMLYCEAGSSTLNRSLTLKPNLQTGQLTEAFFDHSNRTTLRCVYTDDVNCRLYAGSGNGHIYRIEDPAAYSDDGTAMDIAALTSSTDFGRPQNFSYISQAEFEGNTGGQTLTATVRYDRNTVTETLGTFATTTETQISQHPTQSPQTLRHDASIGFHGSTAGRVVITRMGLYYEDQPEPLTYLDSGILTFPFVQQLKRFQIDITAPGGATLALYIDDAPVMTLPVLVHATRERRPLLLPAGLRGTTFRITFSTTGAPFLCYSLLGFFKQLGTDQEYTQVALIEGLKPAREGL